MSLQQRLQLCAIMTLNLFASIFSRMRPFAADGSNVAYRLSKQMRQQNISKRKLLPTMWFHNTEKAKSHNGALSGMQKKNIQV
jgi:hypothetical protein